MQRTKTILLTGLLFLTVSVAFGQKVKIDYDHTANFTKYKTYSWLKEPDTPKDPLMKQRIIELIAKETGRPVPRFVDRRKMTKAEREKHDKGK